MGRFIYVFEERAKKDLQKRGYTLLKEDTKNQIWVFENKDPGNIDFEYNYQCVLSNVMSF